MRLYKDQQATRLGIIFHQSTPAELGDVSSDATPRAKPTLINVVQAQRISPDCKEKLADGGRVYPAACKEKECDLEAPPIATCSASPL